jgi:hypothetical protein
MVSVLSWTLAFVVVFAVGIWYGTRFVRRGGLDRILGWTLVAIIAAMPIFHLGGACVNNGPSMNYLGWVYWTDWGKTPEVGAVFRFVPADKPAWTKYFPQSTWVKRCVDITPEGLYVFEGDNTEWSTDNRDKLEPVPADHIAGTICAASHPSRTLRWFTPEGRFRNRTEMELPRKGVRLLFSPDNQYLAVCNIDNHDSFVIIKANGSSIRYEGKFTEWKTTHIVAYTKEVHSYLQRHVLDVKTGEEKVVELIKFQPNT